MVDVLGAEVPTPNFSFTANYWLLVTILIISVLAIIFVGLIVWFIVSLKVYNRKIHIYENIAGRGFQLIFKDRARVVKVGEGGEELLYLKKKKVYISAYGRKMGKNLYWYAVGQDGYWYNVVLGDVDAKMGLLDIEPIDRDMRYTHVANRKNIQGRYRKKKMEKVVMITIGGILLGILIMVVGNWFILSKMGDMMSEFAVAQSNFQPVADSMQTIASHLDQVCSGGGLTPA